MHRTKFFLMFVLQRTHVEFSKTTKKSANYLFLAVTLLFNVCQHFFFISNRLVIA